MAVNLLAPLPDARSGEVFETLLSRPGVRIERIVSHGQATSEDVPYDQPHDEWIVLLAGRARLWIAGEGEEALSPGDCRLISAHRVHRVTWTAPDEPTVWLAIHMGEEG